MWGSKMFSNYATRAVQSVSNMSQLGKHAYKTMSGTAKTAMYGMAAGAAYGAMSDNTSVLGGAMMGAGIGAAGHRYGNRGKNIYNLARNSNINKRTSVGYGALSAARLMKNDTLLMSNKASNGFSALRTKAFGGIGGGY